MVREITGCLEDLKRGKKYVGVNRFVDDKGVAWELEKKNKDWVIRRVAKKSGQVKKKIQPETAKEYWKKILLADMVETMFKGKVAANHTTGNLLLEQVEVNMNVGDEWVDLVVSDKSALEELNVSVINSSKKSWIGINKALQIPYNQISKMGKVEKVEFMLDLVDCKPFQWFVAFDLLGEGNR